MQGDNQVEYIISMLIKELNHVYNMLIAQLNSSSMLLITPSKQACYYLCKESAKKTRQLKGKEAYLKEDY